MGHNVNWGHLRDDWIPLRHIALVHNISKAVKITSLGSIGRKGNAKTKTLLTDIELQNFRNPFNSTFPNFLVVEIIGFVIVDTLTMTFINGLRTCLTILDWKVEIKVEMRMQYITSERWVGDQGKFLGI